MHYVLIFLPKCSNFKKCFNCKSSTESIVPSQLETNMPITEIEETTNLNQTNKKLLISINNLDRTDQLDSKITFNAPSIDSPYKLNKLNSSSLDLKTQPFKKNLIKPEATESSYLNNDRQSNINHKAQNANQNDEDLNNNDKESRNQLDDYDADDRIEMKTFTEPTKIVRGSSYEASIPLDQEANAQIFESKNEVPKKKFFSNRSSVKQLQRSVSEKSNDNTAKQVNFLSSFFSLNFFKPFNKL